ncbi:MAG TPA: VWA domain-containing protein [Vicinamibacterales bacterium]|nr:VWA domain-containing protein [Vicinamibacterales bacterium]
MTPRRLLAAAIVLASLGAASQTRLAAQPNLRAMYVSVVDEAGAPVPGLGPSDFMVREDNIAREVLRVAPADEPMQIAVLVDTSQAARNDIAYMRTALPTFVAALTSASEGERKNQVAIIGFGERPTILAEFSTSPAALQKGIDRIWPMASSGPYLLDAISETCQGFKKREALRPVIVAIAAEGEELSYQSFQQVLDRLGSANAPLYALMLGTPYSGQSDESRNRQIVLDRGTSTTGGYREQLLTGMALGGKLKLLAGQLTHQYLVTYSRPESLIPPDRITVAATRPGMTARGTPAKTTKAGA